MKFGPIEAKLDDFVVEGQASYACKHDCEVTKFRGNEGGIFWGDCESYIDYTAWVNPFA